MTSRSTDNSTATAASSASAARDRGVDLVRAAALIRVIVFHATGNFVALTALPAMPLMFFLGGTYMERSLRRGAPLPVIEGRVRRLALPAAVYVATIVAAMAIAGHGPGGVLRSLGEALIPTNSGEGTGDSTSDWLFSTLWYLRDYVLLAACSPLIALALRRARALTLATVALALVAAIAADLGAITIMYGGFWVLGMSGVAPTAIERLGTTVIRAGVVVGALGGAALVLLDPASRVGHIGVTAAGLAWIAAVEHFRPALQRVASGARTARAIDWMMPRAVTIYLWQMIPVVVAFGLAGEHTRSLTHAVDALWVVPFSIVATMLLAAMFAPIERLAGSHHRLSVAPRSS